MQKHREAGIPGTIYEVYGKEDLNKRGVCINQPPPDGNCECCGKSFDKLKPFDPLAGEISGPLLTKMFRTMGRYDHEVECLMREWLAEDDYEKARKSMVEKYGEEKIERADCVYSAYSQVGASWECRDCAPLDDDEYFDTLYKFWDSRQEQGG